MLFLLIMVVLGMVQVRTEIPTGKYFKMVGPRLQVDPSCAQTGMKSSL